MATPMIVSDECPSAQKAVALLLRAIGENPDRQDPQRTPERVAQALAFLSSGASKTPLDVLEEVAGAIAWLLDAGRTWITGQVLGVDAGLATVRSRG